MALLRGPAGEREIVDQGVFVDGGVDKGAEIGETPAGIAFCHAIVGGNKSELYEEEKNYGDKCSMIIRGW